MINLLHGAVVFELPFFCTDECLNDPNFKKEMDRQHPGWTSIKRPDCRRMNYVFMGTEKQVSG